MGNTASPSVRQELPTALSLLLEDCTTVPFGNRRVSLRRWLWSYEAIDVQFLESSHDYVQYILPIDTPSEFNPDAPVVLQKDVSRSQTSVAMLDSIAKSATLMLAFWGIRVQSFDAPTSSEEAWSAFKPLAQYGLKLVLADDPSRAHDNIAKHGHNMLRMTRLVKCLRLFGFTAFAMEAALILNIVTKSLQPVSNDRHLIGDGNTVFTVPVDGDLKDVVFCNEYLAKEFLMLQKQIPDVQDDNPLCSSEQLYFYLVQNKSQFDFLQYAEHVQKMWKK